MCSIHMDRSLTTQQLGLLISLAFGNHLEMLHWDISVTFTNANAEEDTYVRFPKSFPDDSFSGCKAGTIARLKRQELVREQIST